MNSGGKNILLNREKKVKSKLINTRKIIQNKFQKVRRDRIKRENDLNEKFRPITQAIDKLKKGVENPTINERQDLNPSADELDWDYGDMDYDTISEYDHQLMSKKDWRARDDDNIEPGKRLCKSHSKISATLSKKNYDRLKLREIRKRGMESSRALDISELKRNQSNDIDDSHNDSDTVVHSIERGKRSRLEKSALDQEANLMRTKNNKKIVEMRKVDDILMGVKSKAIADSLDKRDEIVEILSDSDVESEPPQKNMQKDVSKTSSKHDTSKRLAIKDTSKKKITSIRVPKTLLNDKNAIIKYIESMAKMPEKEASPPPYLKNFMKKSMKPDGQKKSGSGIEADFIPYNENVVYEFYDDPNEICERLRLLVASRAAGNSNHSQEINSIISELREAGVIF